MRSSLKQVFELGPLVVFFYFFIKTGKIEESIGAKETNEIAVMIDTFKPLKATSRINEIDDKDYPLSWLNNCLLYTSPSPRDATLSRMPSSA